MILYLDSGALVALYVDNHSSAEVQRRVEEASIVATSVVAYPEVVGTFAILHQRGAITAREQGVLHSELDRDWPHLLKLEVGEQVWRRAAALAETYVLAGADALHVAGFLLLATASQRYPTVFWSPSERLRLAANAALAGEPVGGSTDG